MFVCASTECFPGTPLTEACGRLVDLEYAAVEVALQALFPRDVVQVTSHLEPASHEHPEALGHDEVADSLSR